MVFIKRVASPKYDIRSEADDRQRLLHSGVKVLHRFFRTASEMSLTFQDGVQKWCAIRESSYGMLLVLSYGRREISEYVSWPINVDVCQFTFCSQVCSEEFRVFVAHIVRLDEGIPDIDFTWNVLGKLFPTENVRSYRNGRYLGTRGMSTESGYPLTSTCNTSTPFLVAMLVRSKPI
jgi:hypothetical protein